jgi:hypothetical protein
VAGRRDSGDRPVSTEYPQEPGRHRPAAARYVSLDDPVAQQRWAIEAAIIKTELEDERTAWRHRVFWVALVLFLAVDILFACVLMIGKL